MVVEVLTQKKRATFGRDSATSDSLAIVAFRPAVPIVVLDGFFQRTGLELDKGFHTIENYGQDQKWKAPRLRN